MPGGIPIELSPEQAALYSSIGSMITLGIGADRAYGILRDTGNYIPRSIVRGIAGEIRTSLGYRADIGRLGAETPVPMRLVDTPSHVHTSDFLHKVSMSLYEPITGTQFTQWFTYRSPGLASKSEIYDAISAGDDADPHYQEYGLISMALVSVETGA